ncbi:MSC_0621 family F1-like ATPase epsilon subunit [Mycoplasmopsis alligatoris]|uniref:Uncharacterized protein n=1 Tax=Mycoplasmopsis alligatoris A21JP2 TaxID=747682 RepID=D4XVL8_9BACT|nr:hypothetical protein [Mycoplasmopsis alligatoris]EFF41712.1 hypothetical protein MALL_0561 [Mycoplasmopsis alligatoris A21JP2]
MNKTNETYFKEILFSSVTHERIKFNDASLLLNKSLIDQWSQFNKNSMGSFNFILVKIKQGKVKEDLYFILENATLYSTENRLDIYVRELPEIYKGKAKISKTQYKQNSKLKALLRKLKILNDLEIRINQSVSVDELEKQKYKLEAIENFQLVKE